MNKTFWLGYVAVIVTMQVLGYLIHNVWLMDTYTELAAAFRPQETIFSMMWVMFIGSLIYLFLFCYIFTKGREGKGVGEGVRYGLLMGTFLSIPMAVDQYVVYPITANLAITWFVTGVISFMIAGAIFAAIYKPSGAATAVGDGGRALPA